MTALRTRWEDEALRGLRALDPDMRHVILDQIHRAVQANAIIRQAGNLRSVRPVAQHRVIGAYGLLPRSGRARPGDAQEVE